MKYSLLELDGKKLISYMKDPDSLVMLDLSDNADGIPGFVYRDVVKSADFHNDNALFYQLRDDIYHGKKDSADCLKKYLVFIDFSDTGFKAEGKYLRNIFRDGIYIRFEPDEEYIHFVTFDKSASMSRAGRISFIREDTKTELDKRLNLGIDFSSFTAEGSNGKLIIDPEAKISLSKFYAYRGLYFTDAERIETEEIELNEDTVIVLKDFSEKPGRPFNIFTTQVTEVTGSFNYKKELDEISPEINFLDGEGIICPSYAETISNILTGSSKKICSFQIRIPFTKGMLHKVDFQKFFRDEVLESTELKNSNVCITDAFGIKRKLSDIKIILTESMFKCFRWLEYAFKNGKLGDYADPMKYFYDMFRKYDHALYISNTDDMFRQQEKVQLNYQFLSTLKMTPEDLDSLISEHIDSVRTLEKNYACSYYSEQDEDTYESGSSASDNNTPAWIRAAEINSNVLSDEYVRGRIRSEKRAVADRIAAGRIDVSGRMRFLSGDLLMLLCQMIKFSSIPEEIKSGRNKKLTSQLIYYGKFYMPDGSCKRHKYYGILRNPHLSRYEQCALKPYLPDKKDIHVRYFGHLNGIIMLSRSGFDAQALGGADFDGDIVKIVSDERIVNAILAGCYEGEGNERSAPYIQIPGIRRAETIKPEELISQPSRTIENTFSNRIGHISNTAARLSEKEYFGTEDEQIKYKDLCAECTIATGLEIDAAKTGIHPAEYISYIDGFADEIRFSSYIDKFEKIKEFKRYNHSGLSGMTKSENDTEYIFGSRFNEIRISKSESENESLNERMLKKYSGCLFDESNDLFSSAADSDSRNFIFDFSGCTDVSPETEAAIKEITESYYSANSYIAKVRRTENSLRNSEMFGHIQILLRLRYGNMNSIFDKVSGETVNEVLRRAYSEIRSAAGSEPQKALDRLIASDWQFTPEAERPDKLIRIVGNTHISDSTVKLVTDFTFRGYCLLYYIIKDICITEVIFRLGSAEKSDIIHDEPDSCKNEFINLFEICRSRKYPSSYIEKSLISKAREMIKKAIHSKSDSAFDGSILCCTEKYDSKKKFFWNVFTAEEILPIIREDREEGKADAE